MNETNDTGDAEVYRDDYMIIRHHRGTRVAVQVGIKPDEERPHIIDATELVVNLNEFLRGEQSDE